MRGSRSDRASKPKERNRERKGEKGMSHGTT